MYQLQRNQVSADFCLRYRPCRSQVGRLVREWYSAACHLIFSPVWVDSSTAIDISIFLTAASKMTYLCVAPYKQTLPTVIRNIFYAEFISSRRLPSSLNQRRTLPWSPPCHRFQTYRSFSSSLRSSSSHPENSVSSNESPEVEKPSQSEKSGSSGESPETKKRSPSDKNTKPSRPENKAPPKRKKKEGWQIQKEALQRKFPEGWNPNKKLSPDAIDGIRQLHAVAPDQFTTPVLAEQFKVSPEAIRRILKSKWRPTEEEAEDRRQRWVKRSKRIWSHMTELGLRPVKSGPKKFSDVNALYDDNDVKRPF